MRVSIISNPQKDKNLLLLHKTACIFMDAGFEVQILEDAAKKIKTENLCVDFNRFYNDTDFVISIGGDGTFVNSAYNVVNSGIPIVGINAGTTGFLADVSIDHIKKLSTDLLNNNYAIEKRTVLKASLISATEIQKEFYAVNEIIIDRGQFSRLLKINLSIDDEPVYGSYGDGLIIAPPTGSTAYSFAAGGPIVDPLANVIVITPAYHHSVNTRPIVVDGTRLVSIRVERTDENTYILTDNGIHQKITDNDILEILVSDKKLNYVRLNSTNYFKTLKKKLIGEI